MDRQYSPWFNSQGFVVDSFADSAHVTPTASGDESALLFQDAAFASGDASALFFQDATFSNSATVNQNVLPVHNNSSLSMNEQPMPPSEFDAPNWMIHLPQAVPAPVVRRLSASVHSKPRDLGEYYHLPVDEPDHLVERCGIYTLSVSWAVHLMRLMSVPEFQQWLHDGSTQLATAMQPPTTESSLNELASYRSVGGIGELDASSNTSLDSVYRRLFALDTNDATIARHLSSRSRVAYEPLKPSTTHFVLLLINPRITSVIPTAISNHAQVSTPVSSRMDSLTGMGLPPSVAPVPSLSSTTVTPLSLIPRALTPALSSNGIIVARDIHEACWKVHKFQPTNYREWMTPLSKSFVDIFLGWQTAYKTLVYMGYDHSLSLPKQYYRWSNGSQSSFKEIVEQFGWSLRVFERKTDHFIWAAEITATSIWDPEKVPAVNP
ncbi:hypothetical protein F5880DRAFT_1503514, partial [Lentinula raphanica]